MIKMSKENWSKGKILGSIITDTPDRLIESTGHLDFG